MVDNFSSDNSGDILVEFDYNNIIIVDPNKTIDGNGNIKERLVDHENLVTYVNLEAEILPRTKLAVGGSPQDSNRTVSIAKINFLAPNRDNFFTNGYYEEFTGSRTTDGLGNNQITETLIQNKERSYIKAAVVSNGIDKAINNGLLGITSINIRLTTSFIPSVDIELEDVQGKALFQLGDNSPYAAFFNLPYPPFYLTIKGYYGKAVRYQLNLEKFNARFNSQSGNYQVRLEMKGYKFNILNEIEMGSLLATPHMYSSRYEISTSTNTNLNPNPQQNAGDVTPQQQTDVSVQSIVTERGYEKIIQVYSEYKAKGLIPQDFPELTLAQFMNKIETFETNVLATYPKTNVQPLTDCKNYKSILKGYFNEVFSQDSNSWFSKWMNPKPLIGENNENYYIFKDFTPSQKETAINELSDILKKYSNKLNDTGVLGENGATPIKNRITINTIVETAFNFDKLDKKKTTTSLTGEINPEIGSINKTFTKFYLPTSLSNNGQSTNTNNSQNKPIPEKVFNFNNFSVQIKFMESEANRKLGEYETEITADLSRKLEDDRLGIGFLPTIRNISAIIMASAEGFIRLLDETHTKAWDVRNNQIRKNVVQNNTSAAPSSDTKDKTDTLPVYPWPQFFVETPNDKKGRFQLKYLADPSVISTTQANNYNVWPEVEFVEEYLVGLTQKFDPPILQPPSQSDKITNIVNINAIEFPQYNLAYQNKEEIKFFYEIYERQFITSHYTGLYRTNKNILTPLIELIQEYESNNIFTSLIGTSPSLTSILKNYVFNSENYIGKLWEFSNQGTGRSYQDFIRDFYVTPYLRTLVDKSFSIIETWDDGPSPQTSQSNVSEQLKEVLTNSSNEFTVMETYPFTFQSWTNTNMVDIDNSKAGFIFDTSKSITVYQPRNVISNFEDMQDYTRTRPVTNFNYLESNLEPIFQYRFDSNRLIPTEGYIGNRVTSMLNTPFFVNAIQIGVNSTKNGNRYPYKAAAYLFLNSLPLISLREKMKTKTNGVLFDDADYMFASLKKFGAVHKLPYAWILKMGSIWHRYKTYNQSNVDILNDCWTNFNFLENYDPITKNPKKIYQYRQNGELVQIQMSQSLSEVSTTQVGFYPKLINDFNLFYNGFELFSGYTDSEIQSSVERGLKIINLPNSNLTNIQGGNSELNLSTWTVLSPAEETYINIQDCVPNTTNRFSELFIMPSFGSSINESGQFLQKNGIMNDGQSFNGNSAVFNGSCRLYWGVPNYGYFDIEEAKKPNTDEYLNKIESKNLSPFRFLSQSESYTKIEELFSVFDKNILDNFETEFLNFCKPLTEIELKRPTTTYNGINYRENDVFRNFQYLMRNMMKIPPQKSGTDTQEFFQNSVILQQKVLQNQIASFLQYDVLFRYGNPTNYNVRIFNSFLSYNNTTEYVVNPIRFSPYEKGSLPSNGGSTTISQSKSRYPNAWKELELQIGFSTIEELKYKDSGSYITDFFIDNNIKFDVDNIKILAPIIKIYATQKLKKSSISPDEFKNLLLNFSLETTELQANILNGVMERVRFKLPNQSQITQTKTNIVDGQVSKVETYEKFKALNDKWIAGGDFTTKTYFEDILFLDRASRNIGETILVDIFELKRMLNKESLDSGLRMSVYTFLAGLLINNNFVIMNLPAYVNFYNIQDVDGVDLVRLEGSSDFANNMWGTFLSVDYTNSGPKMVCFFAGKPSSYLELPNNKYYGFRNDAFDFRRTSEVPLIEDITNKKDYAKSNRCVGFNVDIGIRNQNVFYSFSVGQDSGKATSESIETVYNLANQAAGVNTATQNVGLYNLYKQRSYPCTVVSLGNAMIQPTMYFNLRHVPMFNGPYMIQEVTHTIQPGSFQTSFTGIRQGIFDLPQIDQYLQSLNRNLLTKLEEIIKNRKDDPSVIPITDSGKAEGVQTNNKPIPSTENSCLKGVDLKYQDSGFVSVTAIPTSITPKNFLDEINLVMKQRGENDTILKSIYLICFITNYDGVSFNGFSNNYSKPINLKTNFYPTSEPYFNKTYSCIQGGTGSKVSYIANANFDTTNNFLNFLYSRLERNVKLISNQGLWRFYTVNYPELNYISSFETVKNDANIQEVLLRLNQGVSNLRTLGVNVDDYESLISGVTKTKKTSVTNKLKCDPPKITSWEPKTYDGATLPKISITGTSLWGQTQVTIADKTCYILFNTEKEIIMVPPEKINGIIKVITEYGSDVTETEFTFI